MVACTVTAGSAVIPVDTHAHVSTRSRRHSHTLLARALACQLDADDIKKKRSQSCHRDRSVFGIFQLQIKLRLSR